MFIPPRGSLFGAALLALLPLAGTEGQEFRVDLTRENRVSFLSDAPLEDFTGVTSRIDGFVSLPAGGTGFGGDLENSEFYFEVDMASLDTGLGLRNRHMRENYLETERYPFASFAGRVRGLREEGDGGFSVQLFGALMIHGVTQNREIACRAVGEEKVDASEDRIREKGPLAAIPEVRVHCAFAVALSDHGIPIPKLMFMKIDELMALELDFHLEIVPQETL